MFSLAQFTRAHLNALRLSFFVAALILPLSAHATTCDFGSVVGTQCRGYLTSGSQWTVPSDWNSSNNTIEVIGGGGSGDSEPGQSTEERSAGGGGAYSKTVDLSLMPGSSITYQVGSGGASVTNSNGNAGGDTLFNGSGTTCDATQTNEVCAEGGGGGTKSAGGSGGAASSGVGSTKYSGGTGYLCPGTTGYGGAGGAAGPHGAGGNGTSSAGGSADNATLAGPASQDSSGYSGTEWDASHGAGTGAFLITGSKTENGGAYGGGGAQNASSWRSGAGGQGLIVITYSPIAVSPTCSVTLSPNPSPYSYTGTPVTLTWSSTNSTQVYINNVGWVNPSGSTQVASQATTDYSCYGYSASYGDGTTTTASLTVTPPSSPTATISASSTSIQTGQSTNITADFSAGSGDTLTADNIDSPVGTGLGATTNPDASKTIAFSTTTAGTYTFYARATTGYYSTWTTYATTTITVTSPPTCTPSTVYLCGGAGNETIIASSTDAQCNHTQTSGTTCASPQYCQAPSSSCLAPAIYFNQSGNYTGNLQLTPTLVQSGETTQVHWSVADAQSCTVTGSNGDSWTGLQSPAGGETSKPIPSQTTYTLSCEAYANNPNITETETVNVTPVFQEL